MSSTTYHEAYGEVTRAQLAAYRKHNVSTSDHDDLVETFGQDTAAIIAAVKEFSDDGTFSAWRMHEARR